tara:strand:+ start:1142 stop:2119 length:978 start_codon:yes stop_codon:yes gene_type:complete
MNSTQPQVRKRTLLPRRYPKSEIHYSDLAVYRSCPAKFFYKIEEPSRQIGSAYMLLGSVFHAAFEDCCRWECNNTFKSLALRDVDYWDSLFDNVMVLHPDSKYDVTDDDIKGWSSKFLGKDLFCGRSLGELVIDLYQYVTLLGGYTVEKSELKMEYDDLYGKHVGTLDLLMSSRRGGLAIADIKTSGMWDKLIKNSGYKKQSVDPLQITHHPQMKHYHWLGWRSSSFNPEEVKEYALLYPANQVPYISGPKAGKARGIPIFAAPCDISIRRYEEDLQSWLQLIQAGVRTRSYPHVYGKIECPYCPWKDECLGDQDSKQVPSYLRG